MQNNRTFQRKSQPKAGKEPFRFDLGIFLKHLPWIAAGLFLWAVAIFLVVQHMLLGGFSGQGTAADLDTQERRLTLNSYLREALISLGFKPEQRAVDELKKPVDEENGDWEILIWQIRVKPDFDLPYARNIILGAIEKSGARPEVEMNPGDQELPLIIKAYIDDRESHCVRFALASYPDAPRPPNTNAPSLIGGRLGRLSRERIRLDEGLRNALAALQLNGPPLLIREHWSGSGASQGGVTRDGDATVNWIISVSPEADFDLIADTLIRTLPEATFSKGARIKSNGADTFLIEASLDGRLSHSIRFTTKHDGRGRQLKKIDRVDTVLLAPPRVAIIIDDIGFSEESAEALMDTGIRITLSILPFTKFADKIAERANLRGVEVMVHLPMEPDSYPKDNPGRMAILTSLSSEEIINLTEKNISLVPHVRGINNHMGSKAMSNREVVKQVLGVVKEHNLYFIDSRTSPGSKGFAEALVLGIPAAEKTVFIDNDEKRKDYCLEKLRELIEYAKVHGTAVAIGHPHAGTIEALKEMAPKFKEEGIEVVFASEIVS